MAKTLLSSLKTMLSRISAACGKIKGLSLAEGLGRKILNLPLTVLLALVVMLLAWSCEHRSRLQDRAAAEQVKAHDAAEISSLRKQADTAIRDAAQSTEAARELDVQRQQLARQAKGLSQSLESLRQQESARTGEVAALSTSEVVERVAARLKGDEAAPAAGSSDCTNENGVKQAAADAPPQPGTPGPAIVLSGQDARKIETAFTGLDSCRQQNLVMAQQVSNCGQQSKLDSALIEQQNNTIAKLNSALTDKDGVIARSEEAHRAEIKAIRGTWQSRLVRTIEYMGAGFIAGVLVR
jgi:hypothetical protein